MGFSNEGCAVGFNCRVNILKTDFELLNNYIVFLI